MSAHQEIAHLRASITSLSKTKNSLEEERDLVKQRYDQLVVRCLAVEQAMDALQQELALCAHGSDNFTTPAAVDLSGCKTLIERLERIAVAQGGALNIPAAREILYAAGASKAQSHPLGSAILKALNQHAQDWEYIEDRTYRYKPFHKNDDAGS